MSLRRVKHTRGTTQIAKDYFATSSKSNNFYALTQHTRETPTGWCTVGVSGSEGMGTSATLYRVPTIPDSLKNLLQLPSSSTPFSNTYGI